MNFAETFFMKMCILSSQSGQNMTRGDKSEKYNEYFNPDLENFGVKHIQSTGARGTLDELFPINDDGVRIDKYDLYPRSMLNYATQGFVPPGSTFKPLTAVA